MQGLHPDRIAGYETHRGRRGGGIGHIDKTTSHHNQRLTGSPLWAQQVRADIPRMKLETFARQVEAPEPRGRAEVIENLILTGAPDL